MEDNRILKLIYTFFLGVLLAIFVGVGINAFYEPPAAPKYPTELNVYGKEPTQEQTAIQQEFDNKNEKYQESLKPYNRNVSMLTLASAIVLLTVSMVYQRRIKFISDGIMLGGLFTLLYSIGRGFASENSKYVFVATTIGLATAVYLGYHRFVREQSPKAAE